MHFRRTGLLRGHTPHELSVPTAIDRLDEPRPTRISRPPRLAAARPLPIHTTDPWLIVHGKDQFHSTGDLGVEHRLGDCRLGELIEDLFHPSTTAVNGPTSPIIHATGQGVAVEIPDVLDLPLVRPGGDLQAQFAGIRRPIPTEPDYHRAEVVRPARPFDAVHRARPLLHRGRVNAWIKEQTGSPHVEARPRRDQVTTLTRPKVGKTTAR